METSKSRKAAAAERARIYNWMAKNVAEFIDERTGEVNSTKMVEVWEIECNPSPWPIDADHAAWDVAIEIAEAEMVRRDQDLYA